MYGFRNQLTATLLPDGKTWRLAEPLVWQWQDGSLEICPAEMETDFASVPDLGMFAGIIAALSAVFGWSIILFAALLICIFAKRIDDDERSDAPACFHDQDYFQRSKPRYVADWHLFVRMRANGIGWTVCFLYWMNLRLFGWFCWYFGKHAKK